MHQARIPEGAAQWAWDALILRPSRPALNYHAPESPFLRDDDGALLPFVATVVIGCLYVGMHSIQHKRAAAEYFWRATALALAGERWLANTSQSDVSRCIGLEVQDVKSLTRPRFMATTRRTIESRTNDIVHRFGGSPFARIERSYFGPRD